MFHAKDGLYFERLPFGDVKVMVKDQTGTITFETTVSQSTVASIVAAVCNRGYSSATFFDAYAFLQQPGNQQTSN